MIFEYTLLWLHIAAGLAAIVSGALAMMAPKGGTLHRGSGKAFVIAMLVTATIGTAISVAKPIRVNLVVGPLTFYLVTSAWLTVRRSVADARGGIAVGMVAAAAIVGFALVCIVDAHRAAVDSLDGIPVPFFWVFGGFALFAALGDAWVLWRGTLQGSARLLRHLWRMSVAMLIATASFFLGQAKLFPAVLQEPPWLSLPVLLVALFTLYWLLRLKWQQRRAATPSAGSVAAR